MAKAFANCTAARCAGGWDTIAEVVGPDVFSGSKPSFHHLIRDF